MKQRVQAFCKNRAVQRIFVILVLAVVVAGGILWFRRRNAGFQPTGQVESIIRTTRLQKTNLNDSVTVTGTIQSSNTSTVTTDQKYAVKEILVNVGDTVQEGDVICTLDTSELEESIQKMKENLNDQAQTANEQVDSANSSLVSATDDSLAQEAVVNSARDALLSMQSSWDTAQAAVAPYWSNYQLAESTLQQKGAALTTLQAQGASVEAIAAAQAEYDAANAAAQQALQQLNNAKQQCSHDSLQQQYQQAEQTYQQARQQLDQLESAVVQAQNQLETSQKTAENASESDELEQLESQLEKCTLRASSSGKITEITATVGSAVNGSAAVIQDTGALELAINIPEYDISDVAVGMQVKITTDATDGEIDGTLTQISPVAGQNGFSAVVTIADPTGLYIGMNATAEILLSTVEDVFVVPIDAVEEQDDGTYVIYQSELDENGEQVFTPIEVTLGAQNDYYVEISGSELTEGMEIRASVLEETNDTTQQMMGGMMMGGPSGEMQMSGEVQIAVIPEDGVRPSGTSGGHGGMGGANG